MVFTSSTLLLIEGLCPVTEAKGVVGEFVEGLA